MAKKNLKTEWLKEGNMEKAVEEREE